MTHFRFFLFSLVLFVVSIITFVKYPELQHDPINTIKSVYQQSVHNT